MKKGILTLNNETLKSLKEKHLKSKDANDPLIGVSQISEGIVRKAAIKIKQGSPPSTMDA